MSVHGCRWVGVGGCGWMLVGWCGLRGRCVFLYFLCGCGCGCGCARPRLWRSARRRCWWFTVSSCSCSFRRRCLLLRLRWIRQFDQKSSAVPRTSTSHRLPMSNGPSWTASSFPLPPFSPCFPCFPPPFAWPAGLPFLGAPLHLAFAPFLAASANDTLGAAALLLVVPSSSPMARCGLSSQLTDRLLPLL